MELYMHEILTDELVEVVRSILADESEEDDLWDEDLWEDDWDEGADLELGYNPYMGCYDWDC